MQDVTSYGRNFLNDYRLILDMPASLKRKIATIKQQFDLDYKGMVVAGGNPFIYLATFSQYEAHEFKMVSALDKIALGFMPFKMHLKNYAQLNGEEIYISVKDVEVVALLMEQLKEMQHTMLNPRLNELPRISIAQRLQPWQFENSWSKYRYEHLSATFIVDKMLLLKRMEGFRSWQILKHMYFQNQYVVE